MAGTLKANVIQLGDSVTASQNFVLKTNVDGSAVLARGNNEETLTDVLSIDANGILYADQLPISMFKFDGTDTGSYVPSVLKGIGLNLERTGAGNYTVTFDVAQPDADYIIGLNSSNNRARYNNVTATSFEITTVNSGGAASDTAHVSVTIWRVS